MNVATYEATVEDGQIKLRDGVRLPEHATVYVVVPGLEARRKPFYMAGPRLANPEQAIDFVKEVVEETPDAGLR